VTTTTRSSKRPAATASTSQARGEDEWLTVDEVCRIVKIGRRTFERYLSRGTGPRIKRMAGNGTIRIRRAWLDDWMEEGTA
jgi:excisionase family DNA binding protein